MLIIYKSKLLRFEKALDTIAKRRIINVNDSLSFDNSEIREYQKLTKDTQLWHGTGRWQHGKDGIVDVMKSFCDIAGLKPSRDVYAVFGGSDRHIVHSISLCRSRMVARSWSWLEREKSLWRRSDLDIVLLQLVLCAAIYGQLGQNVAPLENLAYIVA